MLKVSIETKRGRGECDNEINEFFNTHRAAGGGSHAEEA
jgi:hypothetical protein